MSPTTQQDNTMPTRYTSKTPAPAGHEILGVANHYWGRGASKHDARRNSRWATTTPLKDFEFLVVPPGAYVDNFGQLCFADGGHQCAESDCVAVTKGRRI